MRLRRIADHPWLFLALALLAGLLAVFPLLSLISLAVGKGAGAAWAHWWCSPAALRSAVHTVGRGGLPRLVLTALEIHWPHFLPALVGIGTLVYLWRAAGRHAEQQARPLAPPGR